MSELLGYRVREFRFAPFGGNLKLEPSFAVHPEAEMLIAASGPAANFFLGVGVLYLKLLGIDNPYLQNWLHINNFIGFVNLIPALPLDGGRIIHAWLNKNLDLPIAGRVIKTVTTITSLLFLILGSVRLINGKPGVFFLLTGIFILAQQLAAKSPSLHLSWESLQYKKKNLNQKGFLTVKPVLTGEDTPVRTLFQHFGTRDYLLFFILGKDRKMSIISEETAWNLLMEQGYDVTFAAGKVDRRNKTCRMLADEVE